MDFVFEAPPNAQISLKNLALTLKHRLGEHANRLLECSRNCRSWPRTMFQLTNRMVIGQAMKKTLFALLLVIQMLPRVTRADEIVPSEKWVQHFLTEDYEFDFYNLKRKPWPQSRPWFEVVKADSASWCPIIVRFLDVGRLLLAEKFFPSPEGRRMDTRDEIHFQTIRLIFLVTEFCKDSTAMLIKYYQDIESRIDELDPDRKVRLDYEATHLILGPEDLPSNAWREPDRATRGTVGNLNLARNVLMRTLQDQRNSILKEVVLRNLPGQSIQEQKSDIRYLLTVAKEDPLVLQGIVRVVRTPRWPIHELRSDFREILAPMLEQSPSEKE